MDKVRVRTPGKSDEPEEPSAREGHPAEHRADAYALALVRRFVARCHPDAEAALLAGSRSCGRGAPGSDYDVILLFGELPNGAWRETSAFEEQVIETFAHDRGTLGYFCREVDRPACPSCRR